MKYKRLTNNLIIAVIVLSATSQCKQDQSPVLMARIAFDTTLQEWDGFGVNYVELAQSTNPVNDPQEYGGFRRMVNEKEITEWVLLHLPRSDQRIRMPS